jgi:S1-C subfamily serine protease
MLRQLPLLFVLSLLCAGFSLAQPPAKPTPAAPASAPALSATAEGIYAAARPRLLQIRTLLEAAGRQSSLGSGFLVSPDGLAVTNYHVVSQYALEPKTYRLEFAAPDGSRGPLKLLAIDVANDLAIVQLEAHERPFFEFDPRAREQGPPKGERLYAMGNPLDLGFTIVEGTYNGLVERSYNERVHFSGALNPGMSGGPVVTLDGRVIGVNVAKSVRGELVSFLVPARHAVALLERVRAGDALTPADSRKEIGRQLRAWQSQMYKAVAEQGFRFTNFGPYRVPESTAPWFTCWARTNADALPKPRALVSTANCNSQVSLFIANDLQTGQVDFTNSYVRSVDLNAFQFASFLSQQYRPSMNSWGGKRMTQQQCHEDFLSAPATAERPPLRAVWCARAYREFEGLYDVSVITVTQDRSREALVSRLNMQGVTYDNALALAKRFVEALAWAK